MNCLNHNITPLYQRHSCVLAEQISRFMRETADGSKVGGCAADSEESEAKSAAVSLPSPLPLVQDAPVTVITEAGGTIESIIGVTAPSRYFDKRHGLGWLQTWKVQVGGVLVVIVDVHERKPGFVSIQRWNGKKWLSRLAVRDADFLPLP
jgi:hypothetical protein